MWTATLLEGEVVTTETTGEMDTDPATAHLRHAATEIDTTIDIELAHGRPMATAGMAAIAARVLDEMWKTTCHYRGDHETKCQMYKSSPLTH